MNSHLTILSVPFFRIARMSLSQPVLRPLRTLGDVAIVAPFADHAGFRRNFEGPRTLFVPWTAERQGRVARTLLAVAEILRVNGYWFRFAGRGMEYYLRNQSSRVGADGREVRVNAVRRTVYRLLSRVGGWWPGTWKAVEALAGRRWWQCEPLRTLAERYQNVTLVQSANWGPQDRALARLARDAGWRTVLLPYTSDQLDVNGYLLQEFDAVCVQGRYEDERAREFHGVPASRIEPLGSAWFRHLELLDRIGPPQQDPRPFVLYAGVAAAYFPRESEFEAIDAIAARLAARADALELVYRPVEFDPSRRQALVVRYAGRSGIRVQWPSMSHLGLDEYADVDQQESLLSYVKDVRGCRLLVMSTLTSMARDVAFLERCGVVANFADGTGTLQQRHSSLLSTQAFPGLAVAWSLPELLARVDDFLAERARGEEAARQIVEPWDYPDVDFDGALRRVVEGPTRPARSELTCAG